MYASIDFTTKNDFRQAVKQGAPIVLYSPVQGMPAINGKVRVEGPWDKSNIAKTWHAYAVVRDMRVVRVD